MDPLVDFLREIDQIRSVSSSQDKNTSFGRLSRNVSQAVFKSEGPYWHVVFKFAKEQTAVLLARETDYVAATYIAARIFDRPVARLGSADAPIDSQDSWRAALQPDQYNIFRVIFQ